MPGGPCAFLQRAAHHRIAGLGRDVQRRAVFLAFLGRQPAVVHAVQPVGMDVALEALHVMDRVRQHQHAALGIHDVVVQLLAQVLPQVDRMVVKPRAFVIKVVRADDGRVPPRVAAAQPALVDHRDIGDAVLLGQVIGRTQPVPARADDHHVIFRPGLRLGPLLGPVLVAGQAVLEKGKCVEARHVRHRLKGTDGESSLQAARAAVVLRQPG